MLGKIKFRKLHFANTFESQLLDRFVNLRKYNHRHNLNMYPRKYTFVNGDEGVLY